MSKKKTKTMLAVNWQPSASYGGIEYFEWEDLGVSNEDEFRALSDSEQSQRVAQALDETDNRSGLCFAQVAGFTTIPEP